MSTVHPISLCMIVKNEEGQLEKCLLSIRDFVDEIVIVDTGSTDKTPDIARKYANKFEVYTACNGPDGKIRDFSMARNRSFDLATHDWMMWVDADDEVQNAHLIPALLLKYSKTPSPRFVMLPYNYSHDDQGRVTCVHQRERIFYPRSEFGWKNPVHEIVVPKISGVSEHREDSIIINHRRGESGKQYDSTRNLNILKDFYKKNGESDVRQLYYLGLEYGNVGNIGESIKFHKRYMELSGWDEEKFMACLEIVHHYQNLGDYENALGWAFRSLSIREGWAESYFALCKIYYFLAQQGGPEEYRYWEKSAYYGNVGLSLPATRTILFINPTERAYDIHRYLNMSLSRIGKVEDALKSAQTGLQFNPSDEQLLQNSKIYHIYFLKKRIQESIDELVCVGELDLSVKTVVTDILDKKPSALMGVSALSTNSIGFTRCSDDSYKTKNPKDIVIYVGFSPSPWTPITIMKDGYGGSEIMAWEMSRQLVSMGHKVRVYGDCKDQEGIFDGVQFLHYDRFSGISADICISSRRPMVFDDAFGVKSKVNLCWIHDVGCWDLTHARALRVDKFLTLSDWHRNNFLNIYKFIHPTQVIKTRNGVRLDRFTPKPDIVRNRHRAIYSSSPDRGLQAALDSWHIVRAKVPDAELHIFYGFDSWSATVKDNLDQINLIEHLKRLIQSKSDLGVFVHGRIGQFELANEFMRSGVWAYPTWFSETSCLSAMEAQAAGLRIVTSPVAALNETVGDRGVMISGDWLSSGYQQAWADKVIEAMLADDSDGVRERNSDYAKNTFGIDKLAIEWDTMLHEVMVEVSENIVPQYKSAI